MFKRDQARIARYAGASPDNLTRVLQFVILTIRQPLHRMAADFDTIELGGNDALGVLFGWKFEAYNHVYTKRRTITSYVEHVARVGLSDRDHAIALIEYFADLPGFGIVKAGFAAQLLAGVGACLDSHNIERYGLRAADFARFKTLRTAKARQRKVARYVDLCMELGTSQEHWDSWCEYVADNQPKIYQSADIVSRCHCQALGLA